MGIGTDDGREDCGEYEFMVSENLDPQALMLRSLRGSSVKDVPALEVEGQWQFGFTVGWLRVECVWRAVSAGRIVLGSEDHRQQFGLPEPVDAVLQILTLLGQRTVDTLEIDSLTSDLTIQFTDDVRIDIFNNSSGYEGWHYCDRQGLELIAQGGGKLLMCYGERKDWKTIHGD
jgi:hypothetical protein